jgi:hypothetical protein
MPGAFDSVTQRVHAVDVHVVPPAERVLADLLPEGARGEGGPATAALVVAKVALPQVDDFSEGTHAGEFAEQTFDERGSASS